ncbi:MAG: hypothetical protein J6V44_03580 [Methanobrevibacter sp.]|nr:hypothetical protein [Methanobrevibacter sp.]
MMEDKIINDVLMYLDGWHLENKSPHNRHKPKHPKHPKYIDAFNEDSEDIEDSNYRKAVTGKEILDMYDVAKIHVLNYIKRPVFPRSPTTHIALCMWTAGLLSQKARFRKQNTENSYNLIKEAKKLLKPHIKHDFRIETISGPEPECDVEHYRLHHHGHEHKCKKPEPCTCMKGHNYKSKPHHKHKQFPPQLEYDVPEWDDFFLKKNQVTLKVLPFKGNTGETKTLKALVRDIHGRRIQDGIVRFYLEDDEDEYNY